jgi:hypothetical protein
MRISTSIETTARLYIRALGNCPPDIARLRGSGQRSRFDGESSARRW